MKRSLHAILLPVLVTFLTGISFVGCGDDDDDGGTKSTIITLADLEGPWAATQYLVTSKDNPEVLFELITLGGSFTVDVDDAGNFTGEALIPEALGGPLTIPFQGNFELPSQESLTVVFEPEIPPFLTSFTGPFELSGDTMEFSDENTTFDFNGDEVEDPATFVGIMVRQ